MTRYTPADPSAWVVLHGDRRVLALEPSALDRADELATSLAGANGFAAALEAIARTGLLTAPGFALLDWSTGPLRAVLRGPAHLAATTDAGEVAASGAGVTTWTEQLVEEPRTLRLDLPGGRVEVAVASEVAPAPAPRTDVSSHPTTSADAPEQPTDPEATIVPTDLGDPAPPAAEPTAAAAPADDATDYDYLFGATVYRTVAGAAVRLPSEDAEQLGDHDGETVVVADILGLAERPPASDTADTDGTDDSAPEGPEAAPVFALVARDGAAEPLDRGIVIGRAPSVAQVSAGSIPRLITIADDADISRNHVRVVIEGDAPVVTDLGSKNGTSVTQPGKPPQRLRGNESTIVLPGTVIDLGGGTEFTIRADG